MKIKVLTAAINDLENDCLFSQQLGEHLGDYFLDALFSDIDSLILYAGIHQQVFGCYRMLARRFPYAIYYKMPKPDEVVVWRVLDMRVMPARTAKHLKFQRLVVSQKARPDPEGHWVSRLTPTIR